MRNSISDTSCIMQRFLQDNESFVSRFLAANYFSAKNMASSQNQSLLYEKNKQVFRSGIQSFVNSAVTSASRKSTMASCVSVNSSLEDAMKAVSADTSRSYLRLEQELVGERLVANARVLEIVKPRTKQSTSEYVGIKQVSYKSLVDPNCLEEFVLLETIGTGVDSEGHRFVYKILRSVPEDAQRESSRYDEYDYELESTYTECDTKHVTGNMHHLVVVLSECATPNVLQLQVWLDVDVSAMSSRDPFGSFTTYHDASSLTARYRALIETFNASMSSSYRRSTISEVAIRERRKSCHLCPRRLGFPHHRRFECSVCGVHVCSQCNERVDQTGLRICTGCKHHSASVAGPRKRSWSKMGHQRSLTTINNTLRATFNVARLHTHRDSLTTDAKAFHNYRAATAQVEDDFLASVCYSDFYDDLVKAEATLGKTKRILLSEEDLDNLSGRTWDSDLGRHA